ncbi:MAG: VOC family protein [Patescibacteria group bacterium]
MKNPIIHFEIPVDDVERARKFYGESFGWGFSRFEMPEDEYWLVQTTEMDEKMKPTSPGINGGMMKRKDPSQPFMNYITVESIDEMIKVIEKNGGLMVMPKMEIGQGMGYMAAFKDTEGNLMGLHQEEKKMTE